MKKLITILLIIIFSTILNEPCLSGTIQQPVISGIITDTNGVPLEGVEVTAQCGAMGNIFYRLVKPNTWTDKNGRFNLPVDFPDISYEVTFRYMYNNSRKLNLIPSETRPLEVQLEIKTKQIVRGIVTDASDIAPVSGAIVKYFGEYQKFVLETKTDSKGKFEFTHLPLSEFQGIIYAQLNDKVSPALMVRYQMGDRPVNLELKLNDGAQLSGHIKSESKDKPIPDCIVSIRPTYSSGFSIQTTTDANGLYKFVNVPLADYKIIAENEDYFMYEKNRSSSVNSIKLVSGQNAQKDIAIKKRVRFEGKVVDQNGKPVEGAIVAIDEDYVSENEYSPFVVRTDKKGKFSITTGRIDTSPKPELKGLDVLKQIFKDAFTKRPKGNDAIEAFNSAAGYGRYTFSPYREGDVVKGVKIQLNGMIRIHGKVTNTSGNPVPNVRIYDETEFYAATETDEQGRFDLGKSPIRRPEKHQGNIEFLAPRPESSLIVNRRAMIIKDSDIESGKTIFYHHKRLNYDVEPDKDIELNVILEQTELITLKGRVTYENNIPAKKAYLTLFIGNANPNTWPKSLNPIIGGRVIIQDRDISKTQTDDNGFWEITTTRETPVGIKLAYWSDSDPNLFSIGVETQDGQNTLIQDIIIEPNETEKEVDINFEKFKTP